MKVTLTNKSIIVSNPTDEFKSRIKDALSYVDKSKQFQLRRMEHNPYQKNSKAYFKLKAEVNGYLADIDDAGNMIIPSGFSHILGNMEVDDQRAKTGKQIALPWKKKPFDCREYQSEAVSLIDNNYRGTICMATGMGKTLVAIHAIRRVGKKALIVCPGKSVASQFYEQLCDAFGSNRVGMLGGGKKQFKDITVGIVGTIRNNVDKLSEHGLGLIIADECFPYDQRVSTDLGSIKIGKLVKIFEEGGALPKVLSYNESLKKFEYKNITHGWRKTREDLLSIKFGKRIIKCTPEHKILTTSGWIAAKDLHVGKLVISKPDTTLLENDVAMSLNDDQHQLMIGSFLGDAHIDKLPSKRYRITETHGVKQSQYCTWKANMFHCETRHISKNGYSQKPAIKYTTKIIDIEKPIPKVKNTCPNWIIDELDARGLAVWFMDDGYMARAGNSANIAVCSFNDTSIDIMVDKLQNMGIDCYRKFINIKKEDKRHPGYNIIKITSKGCSSLIDIISPYVHKSMSYKVLDNAEVGTYAWNDTVNEYGTLYVQSINPIKNKTDPGRTPYVFDIEVEDNHNFVLCSQNNLHGPVVHNCHHTPADTFYAITDKLGDTGQIFGLTATAFRGDGKDAMITAGVGSILINRDASWGVANGFLAKPYIFIREVRSGAKEYVGDKLKNYKSHVLNNKIVKQQIQDDCANFMSNGKSVLCLVSEVAHGKELAAALGVPFACGEDKNSLSYINDLNEGKIPGLVGTGSFIGEGSDTKNVDVLVVANFVASKGPVMQCLGRGLRKTATKDKVIVIDYNIVDSKMLSRHCDIRVKVYKEITSDIKTIK